MPDYKDIWLPAWKKIWKPVVISEWFPTPDHHGDHAHDNHGHIVSGWDRKDTTSQSKVIWKRDNSESSVTPAAALPSNISQNKQESIATR